MTDTSTPRTDNEIYRLYGEHGEQSPRWKGSLADRFSDFARELERELADAKNTVNDWNRANTRMHDRIASLERCLREVRALIEPYDKIDSWMPPASVEQALALIDDHLEVKG